MKPEYLERKKTDLHLISDKIYHTKVVVSSAPHHVWELKLTTFHN
jgi:hypothetical protein